MLIENRKYEGQGNLRAIEELGEILYSLSGADALKIFIKTAEGIKSSTQTIKELNLTQKRYYVALKRLIEADLVEKRRNTYVQTMLGALCFKMGQALVNAVCQRDQLALADKLVRSENLSEKEKEEILNAISKKELLGPASLADVIHGVRMITDYNTFLEETTKLLDNAKEDACVATEENDNRITDAAMNAIDRGVNLFFLSVEEDYAERTRMLKMILSPAMVELGRKAIASKRLNFRTTEKLPFSFTVIDSKHGIIKLPHPISKKFYFAFEFDHTLSCHSLRDLFTSLYEEAKDDTRVEAFRKYLSLYR